MPNDKMSGTMGAFLFVKLSVYVFINLSLEYSLSFTFSSRFVDLNVTQLSGWIFTDTFSQFIVSTLVSEMLYDKMSGTMGAIAVCKIIYVRNQQPFL